MEDVKKALECAVVDDDILGVLIKGPTGTAKSVLVRSFVDMLPDKDIVSIPQNVTDEQLFGGLDIEDAIISGKMTIKGGTLQRADNNILYLDNVNLFDPKTLNSILEYAGSGKVIVEREGVSAEYDLRTTIIATMDPAEQALPDSIADRFDICVQSYTVEDEMKRIDIISSNLEFDADPEGFIEQHPSGADVTLKRIENAKRILKDVRITEFDIEKIAQVCMDLNVKGHRADISTARTARILAALDNRTAVSDDDIKEASVMCLLHRRSVKARQMAEVHEEEEKKEEERREVPKHTVKPPKEIVTEEMPAAVAQPETYDETLIDGPGRAGGESRASTVADIISSVSGKLEIMDNVESVRLHQIAGAGRRRNIPVKKHSGRYRGSRIPDGRSTDLAFDATIRAAAPYQRSRADKGLSIRIEPQDIREKVRMKRDSCSFIFAVDVSGSLVDSGMMRDIKNGVKAMLMDGYVQRDKVALMTFRTWDIKISVPFTRSVEGICNALDNTETGGGTPLGAALLMIRDYLHNYLRKNPEERCYVILMTDGDATDPVIRGDVTRELKKMAPFLKIKNTEWVVVDSSLYVGRINYAQRLADLLNGRYIRLEDLQHA
jgi:magnesium chelatase subunit D